MSAVIARIIWRRLDIPGHDEAELNSSEDGSVLSGSANFVSNGQDCRFDYRIDCGPDWQTSRCTISGFVGSDSVSMAIERDRAGRWTVDRIDRPDLAGCEDIDLSFTPATNLLPVRRLDLVVGERAEVRAAWVRFPELDVQILDQVYTRLDANRFLYQSGDSTFERILTVDQWGFVTEYPGLWITESISS
ncbi:MAG: putative glycolipid-binding domain-containing protein [Gemmatimonadaceae bacterium]